MPHPPSLSTRSGAPIRRNSAAAAIACLVAVLLLAQFPSVVAGEHGGRPIGSLLRCDRPVVPPRCTSVGNNLFHFVAFDASLTPGLAASLRQAMEQQYSRTKLTLIEQEEVAASTDVVAYSADYGENGAAGWVYCPAEAPQGVNLDGDRWCRQQEMHFNLNPGYRLFFDDDPSRDHVTCHELGHTLGLRHWGNPPESRGPSAATCMNSNTPNGPTGLHQADLDHIDAYSFRIAPPHPWLRLAHHAPTAPGSGEPAPMDPGLGGTLHASEVERPTTLAELVSGADAVVRGRIVDVEPGRAFGSETHRLHYAAATVEVIELLAGRLPEAHAGRLTLELPLFAGPEALGTLRSGLLDGERILALRNKGTSAAEAGLPEVERRRESAFYRLVTFDAELVAVGGRATASGDEPGPLAALAGERWEAVIAMIRAAPGSFTR